METFTWRVDVGSSAGIEFAVDDIEYGDGYDISVSRGINNDRQTWTVSTLVDLRLPESRGNQILAFLRRHAGFKSFLWETPWGDTIRVKASALTAPSEGATVYTLRTTFRQTFSE